MRMIRPSGPGEAEIRVSPFLIVGCLLVISQYALGQECKISSQESPIASIGANEVITYRSPGKIKTIKGKVVDPNGVPLPNAIVDVFTLKESVGQFETEKDSIQSYRVDNQGSFCIAGLPDGDYELRFGTNQFAFKHVILRVKKRRSGSMKPIEVTLRVGT